MRFNGKNRNSCLLATLAGWMRCNGMESTCKFQFITPTEGRVLKSSRAHRNGGAAERGQDIAPRILITA